MSNATINTKTNTKTAADAQYQYRISVKAIDDGLTITFQCKYDNFADAMLSFEEFKMDDTIVNIELDRYVSDPGVGGMWVFVSGFDRY